MRYAMCIEYDGAAFCGWQSQKNTPNTVQQELQRAISIALGMGVQCDTLVPLVCAGRTDAGVHARDQWAHFDWPKLLEDEYLKRLQRSLNGLASPAVRVHNLQRVAEDFHARYHALRRTYCYTIFTRPVAVGRALGWDCSRWKLNEIGMAKEAQSFLGTHDFKDFCIPRQDGKSTICTLEDFYYKSGGDRQYWWITGNRFLHRMVRSMMGILVDIGRGRLENGSVEKVFAGTFCGERTWAPPQGLCLERVDYPEGSLVRY